jgi:hypothetical protein
MNARTHDPRDRRRSGGLRATEARCVRVQINALWALLVTLALICSATPARAAAGGGGEGSWQFAPAPAPPPAPGVEAAHYPVPLGKVGDIEFWAPNRGLLIEGGNPGGQPVPAGVYAYNGREWHQLSTVCGGAGGRIAWAGPDEFWTIADQRGGQTGTGVAGQLGNVSLCHFAYGHVVGSYALPLDQPDSYRPMDAAACASPTDCWFAGALGQYPNVGSFHLHWDGQNVTVVYDSNPLDAHTVTSMANYRGALYEGVQLTPTDQYGGDTAAQTPVLHTIEPNESFSDAFLAAESECSGLCPSLPQYGADNPETLSGFLLSSDGGLSADPPTQTGLWAIASPLAGFAGSEVARPILLHCGSDSTYGTSAATQDCGSDVWAQAPSELLSGGQQVAGLGAEPGGDAAWIALRSSDEKAHLVRVTASEQPGKQTILLATQATLGLGGQLSEYGNRGNASVVSCPTANDCWLATDQGWLYHYTTDSERPAETAGYPEDTDPNFQQVITYRPPDPGIPQLIADIPPPDDSLANQQPPPPSTSSTTSASGAAAYTTEQLVSSMHSRLVHRDTLELSFKLAAQAHVQLLANRRGHVVASTPRQTLKAGRRKLLLVLDPKRWPTKLNLRATPLHPLPRIPVSPGSGGGSSMTVPPPTSAESVST